MEPGVRLPLARTGALGIKMFLRRLFAEDLVTYCAQCHNPTEHRRQGGRLRSYDLCLGVYLDGTCLVVRVMPA